MSHYTQDTKKLQLLADYFENQSEKEEPKTYQGCQASLKKISGSSEFMDQTFTGSLREKPTVGVPVFLNLVGNVEFSWFRTSPVTSVIETSTGFTFSTLNSEYNLELIDA